MRPRNLVAFCALIFAIIFAVGCGAGSSNNTNNNPGITLGGNAQTGTIFVVVMENKNYSDVVGSAIMPYFNSLIPKGALATKYYANLHPSIGNYFILTTGLPITVDDSFSGVVSDDNIARQLVSAGKTWKVYAENLPSPGYLGGDVMPYLRRHNPFSFFSDVQNNPAQAANIVPFGQLQSDLAANKLPNLAFIVPNAFDSGHSCPTTTCTSDMQLQATDTWMQSNLPSILSSAAFKNNGVLVVTWDESATDLTNGGGQVATLFLGPQVKTGFQSTAQYQHQDLLRMMANRIGLASAPGVAANASTMSEFFQ